MTRNIQWPRIAAEGVTIVVSILLAFTIQASGEGHRENKQRDAIMLGLESDFAQSDARLRGVSVYDSVRLEATQRLLQLSRMGRGTPELAATVDTLLTNTFWGGTFEPATGTLDALTSSGTLDLLSNPALAADLTSWLSGTETLRAKQRAVGDYLGDWLLPYLRSNQIRSLDLVWSDVHEYDRPWESRHTDAFRLVGDAEFESLIADLWFMSSDIKVISEGVRERLDRIRAAVRSELDGR